MIKPIELSKSCRLMNPGPTVLITSGHAGRTNVMAASWSMALDFSPPKVAVVIAQDTYTRELVEASGVFTINIPSSELAAATLAVGHASGRDFNKFETHDLKTFAGNLKEAPLIEKCLGWLECRVVPERHNQDAYDLFIGEVVAAWADERVFKDGHWLPPQPGLETLHYIAGGNFFVASSSLKITDF